MTQIQQHKIFICTFLYLQAAYTYQSKLVGITANGYAHGTIKTVDISASLSADFDAYNLTLNNFAINDIG